MQDRKEYILQKAFEVFMAKGYDSVSMTVLQQELRMSRGAMYRYYNGKDDLFKAVIDRYFYGMIDFVRPNFSEDMTLAERIEQNYQSLKKISAYFDRIEGISVVFLNYTALLIQAAKRYSGFIDRLKVYKETETKKWRLVIENSIEKGEVREDIDVEIMSMIFTKSVDLWDPDKPGRNFSKASEDAKKMMNYIYSLIKT
ncbi:MAG: TetR/AcrR family transcriptional regulator [Dysgonamonadaceae bacterium]|jgi:AcrR family transcriptional regulator|nr:TetR/AcrR family transcriptional regulator [Dysgonamonadaceae bacterium]